MSTAHRHVDLARAGAPTTTVVASWSISGGKRLVWSLTVAQATNGPVPLKAEALLESNGSSRSLVSAAADDVDLVDDPAQAMLHAKVRTRGVNILLATFRREGAAWKLCYAFTTLLSELGLQGGRYEIETDR